MEDRYYMMLEDSKFMQRALELAQRGEGLTRPNPPVGAVLVRNGEILAEGWHQKAGGPHAEAACLVAWRNTGDVDSLHSATLYITLEPCSTHGRTPPCTELIIEQGVGRVVIAVRDPNPQHAGRGLEHLRANNIETVEGVCEAEGRELIAPFGKFIITGLPRVILKLALTLDGRIADSAGLSRWITGPEAREKVQALRRRSDAILVGAGTVRADDPSLLPRPDEGREPWRVIVGKNIPPSARVLTDSAAGRTLLREGPLPEILRGLAREHGIMQVLCEGGGKLAASLIRDGLVDEFAFFYAPKILGGDGRAAIGPMGFNLPQALNLRPVSMELYGTDLLIRAVPA